MTAKKEKIEKKEKVVTVKSTVKLTSYTIKAVIPTGAYANIQPEITVSAENLQDAENYVIPHINKLFEDFLNKSERRTVVPKVVVAEKVVAPTEVTKITVDGQPTGMIVNDSFAKAQSMIDAALDEGALMIIKDKIMKSVKLEENQKGALVTNLLTKLKEIKK